MAAALSRHAMPNKRLSPKVKLSVAPRMNARRTEPAHPSRLYLAQPAERGAAINGLFTMTGKK
tara:strand:+ start:334 stop:522 length:189 start_codon:yes stop_codon:yes gene_type:complete